MTTIAYVDDSLSDQRLVEVEMRNLLSLFSIRPKFITLSEPPQTLEKIDILICDMRLKYNINGFEVMKQFRMKGSTIPMILRTGMEPEEIDYNALKVVDYVVFKDGAGGSIGRIYQPFNTIRTWLHAIYPDLNLHQLKKVLWTGRRIPTIKGVTYSIERLFNISDYEQFDGVVITGSNAYMESKIIKSGIRKSIRICVIADGGPDRYPRDGIAWADYVAFEKTFYSPDAVLEAWTRRFQ